MVQNYARGAAARYLEEQLGDAFGVVRVGKMKKE
jgi:hypothetical protein